MQTAPRAGRGKVEARPGISGGLAAESRLPNPPSPGHNTRAVPQVAISPIPFLPPAVARRLYLALPERRPRGPNIALMADHSATRYTAETRSVADQSSDVEEKAVQVCGRNFHIVRSAKGAYVLHPGWCRALSVWKPVGRRMPPATGLFDDSHLQGSPLVPGGKPSDQDNYTLTPKG